MHRKIMETFKKVGMYYFFGDYFDGRFYVGHLVSKTHLDTILDAGCGTGVLLHCSDASLKIGIDISLESLKQGKLADPSLQLIQADGTQLPFVDGYFSYILDMHLLPEIHKFQGENWKKCGAELSRISTRDCQIIMAGANRMSRHFENAYSLESRKQYLTYKAHEDFFKDNYHMSIQGYGPHSRIVMFPLKFLFKFSDKFLDISGINKLLFKFLRSKRYLKNGRSYIIFCKKKSTQ